MVLVLIPVLVLAAGFVVFCEVDLARAEEVRYLPKWAWTLICLAQTPAGGIAYLCAVGALFAIFNLSGATLTPSF